MQKSERINMFIIDWEYVQFGHHAYDFGQVIGDFYERRHFNDAKCTTWAIQGLINGYGSITEEMAFRTAIHAGVNLICWYVRRSPTAPLPAPLEQVRDMLKLATDFVVKGWEKDRRWFEDTPLSDLFMRNK
jgi:thiamine kinase-like enzyme